jgi:hypothetical protein
MDRDLVILENRISILKNEKRDVSSQLYEVYKTFLLNGKDPDTVTEYCALHGKHKQISKHIQALEHKRFNLQYAKRQIIHNESISKTKSTVALVSIILMVLSIMSFANMNVGTITGFAASATQATTSTVTIAENVAIQANNLATIDWSTSLSAGSDDNAAAHNADGTAGVTTYNLTLDTDNSLNLDFCVKADAALTNGGDSFPLDTGTLTGYGYSALYGSDNPLLGSAIDLTTSYYEHITNVGTDGAVSYRFWLDVPNYQEAGTYTNAVTFKAVKTGDSC